MAPNKRAERRSKGGGSKKSDEVPESFETGPEAVHRAAQHAASLVVDGNQSDVALGDLDAARERLIRAWGSTQTSEESTKDAEKNSETFRAAYVGHMAEAFGDILETMRNDQQQADEVDVSLLAECLQSGCYDIKEEDRELYLGRSSG